MTDPIYLHLANSDMVEGFRDGYDLSAPEPSDNRSRSYRHGFANGRDDRSGKPRAPYRDLLSMTNEAMDLDAEGEILRMDR